MSRAGLTQDEIRLYSRHLILPQVGTEGQERLKAARVLLVGAGGLGSPAALYLAAAGVGTLGLVDFDTVDVTNLHRQVLYGHGDVGRAKTEAAAERLADLNPHVRLVVHQEKLDSNNALEVLADYDIVVDGSDNFPTRYLVNDACVFAGKPNVYGSIFRFEGQVSVFWGAKGPCYRCLFPEPPPPGAVPSCEEGGVLGVLPGIIGSLQANEAIKLALGVGEPLVGRLVLYDALGGGFRELRLAKAPLCPVCSATPTLTELIDYEAFCGVAGSTPGEDAGAEEEVMRDRLDITPTELRDWRESGREVTILDVRSPLEYDICKIEGSVLIPLGELPSRHSELAPGVQLAVYCHRGPRSIQAVQYLRGQGFEDAVFLAGGIEAWSLEVDPDVPRY